LLPVAVVVVQVTLAVAAQAVYLLIQHP